MSWETQMLEQNWHPVFCPALYSHHSCHTPVGWNPLISLKPISANAFFWGTSRAPGMVFPVPFQFTLGSPWTKSQANQSADEQIVKMTLWPRNSLWFPRLASNPSLGSVLNQTETRCCRDMWGKAPQVSLTKYCASESAGAFPYYTCLPTCLPRNN